MNKKTLFEVKDAQLIGSVLNGDISKRYNSAMSRELKNKSNGCIIFDLSVLLEDLRSCISVELNSKNTNSEELHNIAQSEFIVNRITGEYDLEDLDYSDTKDCFKEISKEFNRKHTDLILDIMYRENKINFALCRSDILKVAVSDFILHVGLECLLGLICVLLYIVQIRAYNNGYVSFLIILMGLKSLIIVMFNITKHIKKYHVLKVIKHNKV